MSQEGAGRGGRRERETKSPVSELAGAPLWKGEVPALQNRLHRQTHSAATASETSHVVRG